ncbi:MAG: hypothetical protein AB8I08_10180 [Sandaracinaceae bacterium]
MARRCVFLCLGLFALGCGGGDGPADGSVDGDIPLVPVGVETAAPTSVAAGETLNITCLLVDAMGDTFTPPADLSASIRAVPEASVRQEEDGSYTAIQAGRVEVACVFESLRLSDETPALVEIRPGSPARVVTTLDVDSVEAGGTSRASCEVFDAFGNVIDDAETSIRSEPAEEGNTFDGTLGTFTKAGRFEVYCDVTGAEGEGADIEVRPGLPASLVLARDPAQAIYGHGQVITIRRLVSDQYGNTVVEARVPTRSEPAGDEIGDGRYRYDEDGIYTVTATVDPPTHEDITLTASVRIVVDGDGPAIACDAPFDGQILDRSPTGSITFQGSVNDLSGVNEVRVNGTPVDVGHSGEFEAPIDLEYGINFVDLAAVDSIGRETSRTCSFLVANRWAPDNRNTDDLVSLRLRQSALDDGDRSGSINSLNDILSRVLNSDGLEDLLDTSLRANNPLKPNACDQRVLGVCVLRSQVDYVRSELNGPNTTTLTLVDGGMRVNLVANNLRLRIRVQGRVAGIPFDTEGWVTFERVAVQAIFNTTLSGGRPRISVRSGSVSTTVGDIDTSFSGLDGGIINIVVGLFNGTVKNLVAGIVTDFVTDNFNDILDDVVSGLDVSTLGTSFDVPRLDSDDTIPLTFGLGFSHLTSTSSRMLFGLGTRFRAPPAHARPTFGAPMQDVAPLLDVSGSQPAGVGVSETILNQALHALWRAGFFDVALSESSLGLPEGVAVDMITGLPPVAIIEDGGRVEISLGAVQMQLVYPDLFAEPIQLGLGVRASMGVRLDGDDLLFEGFRIEELYFSTDLASLDMSTRDTIEGFLRRLLERILQPALNDALPAIPIPSFELPTSLAPFDIPAGDLGVVSPTLATEPPHFVLRGGFAVR